MKRSHDDMLLSSADAATAAAAAPFDSRKLLFLEDIRELCQVVLSHLDGLGLYVLTYVCKELRQRVGHTYKKELPALRDLYRAVIVSGNAMLFADVVSVKHRALDDDLAVSDENPSICQRPFIENLVMNVSDANGDVEEVLMVLFQHFNVRDLCLSCDFRKIYFECALSKRNTQSNAMARCVRLIHMSSLYAPKFNEEVGYGETLVALFHGETPSALWGVCLIQLTFLLMPFARLCQKLLTRILCALLFGGKRKLLRTLWSHVHVRLEVEPLSDTELISSRKLAGLYLIAWELRETPAGKYFWERMARSLFEQTCEGRSDFVDALFVHHASAVATEFVQSPEFDQCIR